MGMERPSWLVIWNVWIIFPFSWEESSQLTFIFFRWGFQPPTSRDDTIQVFQPLWDSIDEGLQALKKGFLTIKSQDISVDIIDIHDGQVGGLEHFICFIIFPYIGNNHPNWLIFFRGIDTTNQWLIDD